MSKIKCIVPGTIVFRGKIKEYIFYDSTIQEIEDEEDVAKMLTLRYVSGGCCGAPRFETPYFVKTE
jgi:hypothetical protein